MTLRILVISDVSAPAEAVAAVVESLRRAAGDIPVEAVGEPSPLVNEQPTEKRYLRRLLVRRRGKAMPLRVEDIDWIEAAGNYVRIHTGGEAYLLRIVIGKLEQQLDPDAFQRIHRSTIVNLDRVRDIRPDFKGDYIVTMQGGLELKLTRAYRNNVFGQFLPEEMQASRKLG